MGRIFLLAGCLIFALAVCIQTYADETLPGTERLDWPEEDLSTRMMDGAHRFVERKIDEAARDRGRYWKYDASSRAVYQMSLHENALRLREIIGVVDRRLPPRMERFGDDANPALVAET